MKVLVLVILLFSGGNAARILCIFPGVAHSHYTVGYSLVKGLANKGHEVTFVSPFEEKEPVKNLKNIVLTGFVEEAAEMMKNMNIYDMYWIPAFVGIVTLGNMGIFLAEKTLSNEGLQKLLKSNEKFDLVIVESFLIDSLHAIPHYYDAPSVLLSTIGPNIWTNHIAGIPEIPSFMPHVLSSPGKNKTPFLGRVYNTLLVLVQKLYDHVYFYPKHNQLVQKHFPGSPNIYDLMYNTSLILANSHVSFSKPLLTTANVIEIGGYHVQTPRNLPEDLQKILDESKNGVVYFSMGSHLKSAKMHPEKREAVVKALGKLKQTVLWKFEDDNLPGKPDNVIIRKWFPQNDVLAHPNVKLFITHGGLLSTIESIYHGVPIVAIPIFGDQSMNAAAAVSAGYAVQINFKELSEKTLSDAIREILTDPQYSENAKARSKIHQDQQVKPIDKAVYWIEYVIRHRGAPHLKSSGLNLTAYQYYMIDVIIFLALVSAGLFIVFYMIIKWILGRHHPPKRTKDRVKEQ